jgi:glycerol-3-phosphate acyltransferase PlsY
LISLNIAKVDITKRGSGNIGATNVARELGIRWGLITLVLDIMKGFLPAYAFYLYFSDFNSFEIGLSIVSLSTLFGHQFSLFQRFRGGKGVATALGIFLAISPISAIISLTIFVITVYISDYVSLGSLLASCAMPLTLMLFGESMIMIVISILIAVMIFLKHRDNIQRLIKGDERRWRKGISRQDIKKSV